MPKSKNQQLKICCAAKYLLKNSDVKASARQGAKKSRSLQTEFFVKSSVNTLLGLTKILIYGDKVCLLCYINFA